MDAQAQRLLGGVLCRVRNADLRSNTYLLAAPGGTAPGSACVVVDPGLDRAAIEQALQDTGWLPAAVLCTHGHFDHLGGAAWLQQRFGVAVHLFAPDLKLARMGNFMMAAFKLPGRITLPELALLPSDGAVVQAAGRRFIFHATPGHTPGSTVIEVDGLLFSGDTLYARRTGLSRLPGEDPAQLRASLTRLLAWAPGHLLVLPGHGGEATISDILAHNQALREFMAAALPA